MELLKPSPASVAEAVKAYDRKWSDLDSDVWARSQRARQSLLDGDASHELESFIWFAIKTWGKVQGVLAETRAVAAGVLADMEWTPSTFSEETSTDMPARSFAVSAVSHLVEEMNARGVKRQEWSAASKVLHWLLPWRVPIYDNVVRRQLGIPDGPASRSTYREILRWEFAAVSELASSDDSWIGPVEPRSPLRALDKYLWWEGGGKDSCATGGRGC